MAYLFIDRHAYTFGIPSVVQGGRDTIILDSELMNQGIDGLGGYAGFQPALNQVQGSQNQLSGTPNGFNIGS